MKENVVVKWLAWVQHWIVSIWKTVFGQRQNDEKNGVRPHTEIPGSKCWPIVGSLFNFNKFGPRKIHEWAADGHKKHGDLIRENLMGQELVFFANTELLKEWLPQEGKLPHSTKLIPSKLFNEKYPQFRRGVFYRDGEEWGRVRKIANNCLLSNAAEFVPRGLFDGMEAFIQREMEDFREVAKNGGLIPDFEQKSYETVLGGLLALVFGEARTKLTDFTGATVAKLAANARENNIIIQRLLELPARLVKMLRLPMWREYEAQLIYNLTTMLGFCKQVRNELRQSGKEGTFKSHGLLCKMMEINAADDDADDSLTDFCVDSKDPIAGTWQFTIQLLGCCPQVQEKIFEEVNRLFPNGEKITYARAKDLVYTDCYWREALRLYPVGAFTSRVVTEKTVLGGYNIAIGTILNYSACIVHRDPRYFAEPERVWPERWLHKDELTEDGSPYCTPFAWAPFGLKGRICVGMNVATSMFVMYLGELVRNFKVISKEIPERTMRTVMYPKNPGNVRLELRQNTRN